MIVFYYQIDPRLGPDRRVDLCIFDFDFSWDDEVAIRTMFNAELEESKFMIGGVSCRTITSYSVLNGFPVFKRMPTLDELSDMLAKSRIKIEAILP